MPDRLSNARRKDSCDEHAKTPWTPRHCPTSTRRRIRSPRYSGITLSTAQTVQGDIATLEVTGAVTVVEPTNPSRFELDGSVSVGSPYQLTFVIDTDAPDTDPDPGRGTFFIVSASGQLGNYTGSKTPAPVFGIEVDNDRVGLVDEYELDSDLPTNGGHGLGTA